MPVAEAFDVTQSIIKLQNHQKTGENAEDVEKMLRDLNAATVSSTLLFPLMEWWLWRCHDMLNLKLDLVSTRMMHIINEKIMVMLQRQQNLKKLFQTFVPQLLPTVLARISEFASLKEGDQHFDNEHMGTLLDRILNFTLFHKDHLVELVPMLNQLNDTDEQPLEKIKAYPKMLLELMTESMQDETRLSIIFKSFPHLYHLYSESIEKGIKQLSYAQTKSSKLSLIKLMIFTVLRTKDPQIQTQQFLYMPILLDTLAKSNMYSDLKDKDWLLQVYAFLKPLASTSLKSFLESVTILTTIDFCIVKDDIAFLLSTITNVDSELNPTATSFFTTILKFFTKARQLDQLVELLPEHAVFVSLACDNQNIIQAWQGCMAEYSFSQHLTLWRVLYSKLLHHAVGRNADTVKFCTEWIVELAKKITPSTNLQGNQLHEATSQMQEELVLQLWQAYLSSGEHLNTLPHILRIVLEVSKHVTAFYPIFKSFVEDHLIHDLSPSPCFYAEAKLVLFLVTHLSARSTDPYVISECRDLVNALQMSAGWKNACSQPEMDDSFVHTLIDSLPVLSRFASESIIKRLTEQLVKNAIRQVCAGDHERKSVLMSLLSNAQFFELPDVRQSTFNSVKSGFVRLISERCSDAIFVDLVRSLIFTTKASSTEPIGSLYDSLDAAVNKEMAFTETDGQTIHFMLALLHQMPLNSFTLKDVDVFALMTMILDTLFTLRLQSKNCSLLGKQREGIRKLIGAARRTCNRLLRYKKDRIPYLLDPRFISNMFADLEHEYVSTSQTHVKPSQDALELVSLTVRKVLTDYPNTLQGKYDGDAKTYLAAVLDSFSSKWHRNDGRVIKVVLKLLVEFKHAIMSANDPKVKEFIASLQSGASQFLQTISLDKNGSFSGISLDYLDHLIQLREFFDGSLVNAIMETLAQLTRKREWTLEADSRMVYQDIVFLVFSKWSIFREILGYTSEQFGVLVKDVLECLSRMGPLPREFRKADFADMWTKFVHQMTKEEHIVATEIVFYFLSKHGSWSEQFKGQLISIVHAHLREFNADAGRLHLKRNMQMTLLDLNDMLTSTESFAVINSVLEVFELICKDEFYDAGTIELSLMMTGLQNLSSGATLKRMTKVNGNQLPNVDDISQCFQKVCQVLLVMVRYRKTKLLDVFHVSMTVTKSMMHAFRKMDAKNYERLMRRRVKRSFDDMESDEKKKDSMDVDVVQVESSDDFYQQLDEFSRTHLAPLFSCCAPLNWSCAQAFARTLQALSQKGVAAQSRDADVAVRDVVKSASLTSSHRPFAKYVMHYLIDFVFIQMSRCPIMPDIRKYLMEGFYDVMDMLGDHERNYWLHAVGQFSPNDVDGSDVSRLIGYDGPVLGKDSARALVKNMVSDWEKHHKFTGKV